MVRRRPRRSRSTRTATSPAGAETEMRRNLALVEEHDSFRDELASVARDGRRKWIHARQPSGRLYRARTVLSVFLIGFLLSAPFITIGGQPLMMLNVLERKFVL